MNKRKVEWSQTNAVFIDFLAHCCKILNPTQSEYLICIQIAFRLHSDSIQIAYRQISSRRTPTSAQKIQTIKNFRCIIQLRLIRFDFNNLIRRFCNEKLASTCGYHELMFRWNTDIFRKVFHFYWLEASRSTEDLESLKTKIRARQQVQLT